MHAVDTKFFFSAILAAMAWDPMPKSLKLGDVKHRISTYLGQDRKLKKEEVADPTFVPAAGGSGGRSKKRKLSVTQDVNDTEILGDEGAGTELLNTSINLDDED